MAALPWLIALVAAITAAFCAVADLALLGLDARSAAAAAATRPGSAPAERAIRDDERIHRALAIVRVFAQLCIGAALATSLDLAERTLGERILVALVSAGFVVLLVEGTARVIGMRLDARGSNALAPILVRVGRTLRPVLAVGSIIETTVERLLPAARVAEPAEGAERFREVVAAEADIGRREEQLLQGVFSLGETEVHEIMVPRVDIVGIAATTPWSEVLDRVRSSEHARFPVFDETLDEILGVLYAKDLLETVIAGVEPAGGWLPLVRGAVFIPISKAIDAQLRDFKSSRTHIAIVSDEYGGTAGIVTIEDVLEEIVGEIRDEYDVEEPEIEREGERRFWVAGSVSFEELSELLATTFDVEDVTTVGGLIYELFGRVPRAGESLNRDGIRIVVERVRRRRVERVYFERVAPATGGAEA